jgi:hypothetical protein
MKHRHILKTILRVWHQSQPTNGWQPPAFVVENTTSVIVSNLPKSATMLVYRRNDLSSSHNCCWPLVRRVMKARNTKMTQPLFLQEDMHLTIWWHNMYSIERKTSNGWRICRDGYSAGRSYASSNLKQYFYRNHSYWRHVKARERVCTSNDISFQPTGLIEVKVEDSGSCQSF